MKNQFFIVFSASGFALNFRGANLLTAISLEPTGAVKNYERAIAVRDAILAGEYNSEIQVKFNQLKNL